MMIEGSRRILEIPIMRARCIEFRFNNRNEYITTVNHRTDLLKRQSVKKDNRNKLEDSKILVGKRAAWPTRALYSRERSR